MTLEIEARKAIGRIDESPTFWGFVEDYNLDEVFIPIKIGEGGCISETCAHYSHGSRAPVYKLVPRENVEVVPLHLESGASYYLVNQWVMKITHQIGRHDRVEFIDNLDYLPVEVVERLSGE